MIGLFFHKVRSRLLKFRLKPIHVFVFHQVSESFDSSTMWNCDWTQIDKFKQNIINLKKRYIFISLQDALKHIDCDIFRSTNYAVLTSDDGWESLKNILPWLVDQHIPVTLFINPLYMDGIHKHSRSTERYLTKEELLHIIRQSVPYISVASHGWSHDDCSVMDVSHFCKCLDDAESNLSQIYGKVPFFAFPWGLYKQEQFECLKCRSIVPVLVDDQINVNDSTIIHRECIDGKEFV